MPLEEQSTEPRRKRAKIVSACSECRRKKTKCNGEHPCRNCEKSGVECVYPSSSTHDDKRNVPSKAALEAIEERLKTIEDMLRTIIKTQNILTADMDPVMNNFLNRDTKSVMSSPPLSKQQQQPHHPHHIHNTGASHNNPASSSSSTTNSNTNTSPPPIPNSPPQQHQKANRLPSIRSLSSSYAPNTEHTQHRDLPPLEFQTYSYPPP